MKTSEFGVESPEIREHLERVLEACRTETWPEPNDATCFIAAPSISTLRSLVASLESSAPADPVQGSGALPTDLQGIWKWVLDKRMGVDLPWRPEWSPVTSRQRLKASQDHRGKPNA